MRTQTKRSSRTARRPKSRPNAKVTFPDSVSYIPEPKLQFGFSQSLESPAVGLSIFGPYDLHGSSKPKSIRWGLLATPSGKQKLLAWIKSIQSGIAPGQNKHNKELNPKLWPVFPGFEAAFACEFPTIPVWSFDLDEAKLVEICFNLDSKKRAYDAVEAYLSAIKITKKKDEEFDVLVCVVPDLIKSVCRPQGVVDLKVGTGEKITKKEHDLRASGQGGLFSEYDPEIYNYSEDFRRQIKARSLKYEVPLQIIKESTITEPPPGQRRKTSPPSDLAWNLSTSIYYKSGGKPWKLAAARPGVCYVGIAFRRTDATANGRTACCAAQLFLDSGDGVVFLGDTGLWYSMSKHEYHLDPDAAQRLLGGVLQCYSELEGQPLTEVFLHSRSGITREEFEGYRKACPSGVKLVAVRVKKEFKGMKLFREGHYPVARGTFWKINEKTGFLWASGFVPKLCSYPGSESPVPIRLDIQHGSTNIETVAADILALTKLNYNACKFGDSEPVTIGFSDHVGEILVTNPTVKERQHRFKFYI